MLRTQKVPQGSGTSIGCERPYWSNCTPLFQTSGTRYDNLLPRLYQRGFARGERGFIIWQSVGRGFLKFHNSRSPASLLKQRGSDPRCLKPNFSPPNFTLLLPRLYKGLWYSLGSKLSYLVPIDCNVTPPPHSNMCTTLNNVCRRTLIMI